MSIFQDGGHKVPSVLPGSFLVMGSVQEGGILFARQILMKYINPRLR